jgi:hypothetical protein
MRGGLCIITAIVFGLSTSAYGHEIHYVAGAPANPYGPYSFLIGDWNVSTEPGAQPLVRLKFEWGPNHAYIHCGAYIGAAPHFEGMMMWNGVHHDLDVLLATDMERGLAQEAGTATIKDGGLVQETLATYSAGVSGGGAIAGPNGSTQKMRETMHPIDSNHIQVSFEVQTPAGWKPLMPGADHLLMTRSAQ